MGARVKDGEPRHGDLSVCVSEFSSPRQLTLQHEPLQVRSRIVGSRGGSAYPGLPEGGCRRTADDKEGRKGRARGGKVSA